MKQKVSIIGLGYIGLPLGLFMAKNGVKVQGFDIDKDKIQKLHENNIRIESGINDLFDDPNVLKNIEYSTELQPAENYIVCVPTPVKDGKSDLKLLRKAVGSIADLLKKDDLVIIESTIPPNTCSNLVGPLLEEKTGLKYGSDFGVVYCPERVLPGNMMYEFVHNDRIIGGDENKWVNRTEDLYNTFVEGKIIKTNVTTAEMVKLSENSFRDVNIAFANELAKICTQLQISVDEVIKIANYHPRVNILSPGIGVGGHCIPVDPYFLIEKFPDLTKLIKSSREINNSRPIDTVNNILSHFDGIPNRLVLLGKSYKTNVKDDRESPALEISQLLSKKSINIVHKDPFFDNYEELELLEEIKNSDGLVVLVPHDEIIQFVENHRGLITRHLTTEKKLIMFT